MSIDLHTHSYYSDGSDSPEEIVQKGAALGLRAIALTDHDNTDGVKEFMEAGQSAGILAIPGVEISASYRGRDIHILGYGFRYEQPDFADRLRSIREERQRRNEAMLLRLQQLGYAITKEDIERYSGGEGHVISRLHFAQALTEKGYCRDTTEAFDQIVGTGCPGYIPRQQLSPEEAIGLIHGAGGKAVLAHPLLYKLNEDECAVLLKFAASAGMDGLEVIHSTCDAKGTLFLQERARALGLFCTGGSDYHGENKQEVPLGVGYNGRPIPDSYLEPLQHTGVV